MHLSEQSRIDSSIDGLLPIWPTPGISPGISTNPSGQTVKKLVSSELGYLYYCKHSHVVMRSWGLQHFSTSLSCLESHAGFFILSMKGRFDVYLLRSVGEKLIFIL